MSSYEDKRNTYDALVAKCSHIERKGKTMPYTSANGYMFSLLNKAGEIGIRFSKDQQKEYLEKYESSLFKSYGATMQGYILITEAMLADLDHVASLLNESYEYVMGLEPK